MPSWKKSAQQHRSVEAIAIAVTKDRMSSTLVWVYTVLATSVAWVLVQNFGKY